MIRLFVPKGAKISETSEERLIEAEEHMNTLPRKILAYRTPEEVLNEHLDSLYSAEGSSRALKG